MDDNIILNGFSKHEDELGYTPDAEQMGEISEKLDDILLYLQKELQNKQVIIETQVKEMQRMRGVIEERNEELTATSQKLAELDQKAESNRQLINKLLGDITHYQNDIEWYKRTYEKRSLWGVMKEKLAKVNLPPEKSEE
ncbi:MAG: hypothetical protein ABW036_10910 [Flavitalea sp.]